MAYRTSHGEGKTTPTKNELKKLSVIPSEELDIDRPDHLYIMKDRFHAIVQTCVDGFVVGMTV